MFTKLAALTAVAAASISGVLAVPVNLQERSSHHLKIIPHFNDWHGLKSFHGFDDFYGYDNFAGVCHHQVILKQKKHLVCRTQRIEIIQQRLVILQELAKKIITEQVCEVETQTVVFQQFHASLGTFHDDLFRKSGRHVGFDAHIAGLYSGIFNHDGSFSTHDLGFRGVDVGKHVIVATGHNWNDVTSPPIVQSAYDDTRKAIQVSGGDISDISDIPESDDSASEAEVTDASEAPAPDVTDSAADAEETASDDGSDNEAASTTAAVTATASVSASAAAATTSNIDPATAP